MLAAALLTWWMVPCPTLQCLTIAPEDVARKIAVPLGDKEHPAALFVRVRGDGAPPEDGYLWRNFGGARAAADEYDKHATSMARGIVSTWDGTIIVYWSLTPLDGAHEHR